MSSADAAPGGPSPAAQEAAAAEPAGPASERSPSGRRRPRELGGRPGPDPSRYGDWERDGRCIDF